MGRFILTVSAGEDNDAVYAAGNSEFTHKMYYGGPGTEDPPAGRCRRSVTSCRAAARVTGVNRSFLPVELTFHARFFGKQPALPRTVFFRP
ncbi:MAG: hypothetical protein LBH70_05905 [Spirochaetaceae bacterium]|nr:hypothetical protein [Spirochaetaceae bacterium]